MPRQPTPHDARQPIRVIGVRVPQAMHGALVREAEAKHESLGALVRQIIAAHQDGTAQPRKQRRAS